LRVVNIIRNLEGVIAIVAYFALGLMMVIGSFDVIGRYIFDRPILGALEVSKSLLTLSVVFLWAKIQSEEKHVSVDLVANHFPNTLSSILKPIFILLMLVFFALISWQAASFGMVCWQQDRYVDVIHLPMAFMYYIICFGAFIACIELCLSLYLTLMVRFGIKSGAD
jgi:TRAP-type C4-dicarboxylate transport system permease small subunit